MHSFYAIGLRFYVSNRRPAMYFSLQILMNVKETWTTVMNMPPASIPLEVINACAIQDQLVMEEIALVRTWLCILCTLDL